jgi:CHAT domain-containing protein
MVEKLTFQRLRSVVLGACWGANAVVLPGRDYVGLPGALVARGAEAVVGSLWDVPETVTLPDGRAWSTAALMRDLYRELAKTDLPEALARVQRRLWRTAPPWLWGGYVPFVEGPAPLWPLRFLRALRKHH